MFNWFGEQIRNIQLITQKELLYVSRDPDVLIYTVLVPLVIYPILFIGANDVAFWIAASFERHASRVIVERVKDKRYPFVLDAIAKIDRAKCVQLDDPVRALKDGKADAYVTFEGRSAIQINVFRSKLVDNTAAKLFRDLNSAQDADFKDNGSKSKFTSAFHVQQIDVAPSQKQNGELVAVSSLGGLPLALLALCAFVWVHMVIGMAPPATVSFAEQREKNTFETMLLEPVSRFALVGAKSLTVWLVGIMAGIMYTTGVLLTAGTLVSMFALHNFGPTAQINAGRLPILFAQLFSVKGVTAQSWLLMACAMGVNSALCSTLYIASVSRAATFKQAQALITIPMLLLIAMPLCAFLPGIELNPITAFIPAMNLFLTLKRGEPNLLLTFIALLWNLVLIGAFLVLTKRLLAVEQSAV